MRPLPQERGPWVAFLGTHREAANPSPRAAEPSLPRHLRAARRAVWWTVAGGWVFKGAPGQLAFCLHELQMPPYPSGRTRLALRCPPLE